MRWDRSRAPGGGAATLVPVVTSRPVLSMVLCALVTMIAGPAPAASGRGDADAAPAKPRVVVLTDMGADPDDEQSLVRLLLYANEIDIDGIVATTSAWQRDAIRPDFIHALVDAYGKVQRNLVLHAPGFPDADALRAVVKRGSPRYGLSGVGDGMDSEGSEWIIRKLDDDDPRPLWISVWGGPNALAQALFKLRATRPEDAVRHLVSKLRVYAISDQDDSAAWLRREFPDLFYIVTPGDDYGQSTWIAMGNTHEGADNSVIGNAWLRDHIQQGHGALGAAYPDVAWGVEGDTPAFLGLVPNGLNVPERPDWGGWGGRYELALPAFDSIGDGSSIVTPEPETRPIWTDSSDTYFPYAPNAFKRAVSRSEKGYTGPHVTLWRWREDFQNDFAARMDWAVMSYEEANHPPVPRLNHPDRLTVKSGQGFTLDGYGSTDPDGDSISYLWFLYPEAGDFSGTITTGGAENVDRFHAYAPDVDREVTLHFILRVTDKGTPPLSRYKRVIVTVTP